MCNGPSAAGTRWLALRVWVCEFERLSQKCTVSFENVKLGDNSSNTSIKTFKIEKRKSNLLIKYLNREMMIY